MSPSVLTPPPPAEQAQSAREVCPNNRFFHQFMAGMTALLIMMAIVCVTFLRYRLHAPSFDDYAGFAAIVVAAGYCRWAKFERFYQACLIVFWSHVMGKLLSFPVYLAARSRISLQDQALAHFDKMTSLEVPAILHLMASHPWAKATLAMSYDLLFPLMVLGVMLPALTYRWTPVKELIVGTSIATILGAAMFALCPAVGPWVVYHFAPSAQQQYCESLFLALRTNSIHMLSPDDTGIICFPSFHVLLAILSCLALCSIKPLRIPAIVISGCVAISTLTTGWHYIADVLGGLTLAVASILIAKAYTRLETHVETRFTSARFT
jgi:membrane-associated phospholipid phosphatase